MPELPEVETIRRHLAPLVQERRISALEVRDPRWCEPAAPSTLRAALRGRTIVELGRRGKYLIWRLDDDDHLVMHLRMTGTLLYDAPSDIAYVRMQLVLDDGHRVLFSDPRRFGTGQLIRGSDQLAEHFSARLGVEPLEPGFTPELLHALTRARRTPVKAFLLDQRQIAGVGNIYADEALFRARIHPLRPAGRLGRGQSEALHGAIREVLEAGIAAKGATIDDYRTPEGAQGAFQDRFLVHRRAGEPCPVCGTTVRKLVAAGRGTYVCPRCQPAPRRRQRAAANPASA